MPQLNKVNIKPGVTILSVLRHLNYKPYYALAEFVDNSIDSYLKNKDSLNNIHGDNFKLTVKIEFDKPSNKIVITDNAAGISEKDYHRAFKAAEIPPDNTKLSEFGMGMKSAAIWFSNKWEVRTSSLSEKVERTVSFDISKIINDELDELDVSSKPVLANSHYTVITLKNMINKMPMTQTLGKIKRHLASIYREFIRDNILELYVDSEILAYNIPAILNTPCYNNSEGQAVEWKQDVEFEFGDKSKRKLFKVKGFVAIMDKMSTKDNGLALFRRGRVIEGSADNDEGFRPQEILGAVGSPSYKRIFGELHIEGFRVSHTKDGFQWDDHKDEFLSNLKDKLQSEGKYPTPILKQADKFRVRESSQGYSTVSKKVVDNTAQLVEQDLPAEVDIVRNRDIVEKGQLITYGNSKKSYFRKIDLNFNDCKWMMHIELSYDDSISELFKVGSHLVRDENRSKDNRDIGIRLSLVHPFMIAFGSDDQKVIEPVLRIVVALGLSEVIAKECAVPIDEVINNMNDLLKGSLSKI